LRARRSPAYSAIAAAGIALLPLAAAGSDSTFYEFWPEINGYLNLGERSRLLFTAAGTRAMEGSQDSDDTVFQNAQFSVNLDYTFAPILRRDVPQSEWSKNRLLWARIGFEYGTSGNSDFRSYTGIVELNSRYALPSNAWLTSRMRVDFRDINGTPSQRYRLRVGAEWDLAHENHPYTPYASMEVLYDTRYDKWSRTTLKTGVETPIADRWRIEPYLALQLNRPDDSLSRVLGLGLTLKHYFD
jgi:hypothetical protein